jgi:hypothetical protein
MLAFLQAYSPPAFHASACAPRVLCLTHYTLPVMVMLLTSTLVFLPAMMFCILVALILVLRMAMVLAACMMVLEVRSAFLVCFHLPPI